MVQHYSICKENYMHKQINVDNKVLDGFHFKPKNEVPYDGIVVNKMVMIHPSFIERVLKRKIKRQLDTYLQFIIHTIDDDSDDDTSVRHALNDLNRYAEIVEYKYQKYLDEKYISLLLQKIALLEHELKNKLIYGKESYQEEKKGKDR